MRHRRQSDYSPRVEMLPLLDVIFLLLTFFIYSLIVMVHAEVLPVTLTSLAHGDQAQQAVINVVMLDRNGVLRFNREPVDAAGLHERLRVLAQDPEQPRLYVAVEAAGNVDRGPLLLDLLEQVTAAGITSFSIVGSPRSPGMPGTPAGGAGTLPGGGTGE